MKKRILTLIGSGMAIMALTMGPANAGSQLDAHDSAINAAFEATQAGAAASLRHADFDYEGQSETDAHFITVRHGRHHHRSHGGHGRYKHHGAHRSYQRYDHHVERRYHRSLRRAARHGRHWDHSFRRSYPGDYAYQRGSTHHRHGYTGRHGGHHGGHGGVGHHGHR